jgi:hypothetical protein
MIILFVEIWPYSGFLLEDCPPGVEKIGVRHNSCISYNIGLFSIYYKPAQLSAK